MRKFSIVDSMRPSTASAFAFVFACALAAVFAVAFASAWPAQAHAALASASTPSGSALRVQDDSTTKRLNRDMLTMTDDSPYTSGVDSVVMKDGETSLTQNSSFTITISNSADADSGKTVLLKGMSSYTGSLYLNYRISDESTASAATTKIKDNISISFAEAALTAVPNDSIAGSCTVTNLPEEARVEVVGTGDYAGQKVVVTYTLEEGCSITRDIVELTPEGEGAERNLVIGITDTGYSGKILKEGVDFTSTITRNTPVEGAFKVEIAGTRAFYGSLSFFCIVDSDGKVVDKLELTSSMVSLDTTVFPADGKEHVPAITVKSANEVFEEGVQYKVTRPQNPSEIGEYTLTVAGAGDYIGQVERTYTIMEKGDFDISMPVRSNSYTAAKHVPAITVKSGDKTLVANTNYEVVYPDNMTDVGVKTIGIKGKGDYKGVAMVEYEITPASLDSSSVSLSTSSATFTGEELTPVPTVTYSFTTTTRSLAAGVDFELEYENNVNAASSSSETPPKVTIKGIGNYKDSKSGYFTIYTKSLASATISTCPDQVYTGEELTPVPTVEVDGVTLEYETDFTVNYYNNTSVGTAYAYIYGAGNYGSSAYKYPLFTIVGRPISDADVEDIPAEAYTGAEIMPRPQITYQGTELAQGTDYTLSYENNTDPGKATMTITGTGTFAGTKTVKFTIAKTGTVPKVTAESLGSGAVKLSWSPIYGATKYRVLEKMPSGEYRTVKKETLATVGTITNLSVTRTHRFLVRAYVDKKWSSDSDKHLVSIKPKGAKKPTVRALSASKTSVLLTWNSVPGADRYAIYEKVGKTFQLLDEDYEGTSATLTQLKKKQKYTFYVQAHIDGKWSKVDKSDYVSRIPADPNPPVATAVGGVGKGKVKISWTKTVNAKKYMVQVKVGKGKWKTLTKNCKKRSYTAKGLAAKSQTFRVRAYGNGKWSKVYSDYYVKATPDNA